MWSRNKCPDRTENGKQPVYFLSTDNETGISKSCVTAAF
jgi:hypothetical protein